MSRIVSSAAGSATDTSLHRAADSAPDGTADIAAVVRRRICDVLDPELPLLSIADLGILRSVSVDEAARAVAVVITPTYSGCPAMQSIEDDVVAAAAAAGYVAMVETRLSPAWTTDLISDEARERLRQHGIAPPGAVHGGPGPGPVPVALGERRVACPLCGSTRTREVAHFGSTACKALRVCADCQEPFDEFKAL